MLTKEITNCPVCGRKLIMIGRTWRGGRPPMLRNVEFFHDKVQGEKRRKRPCIRHNSGVNYTMKQDEKTEEPEATAEDKPTQNEQQKFLQQIQPKLTAHKENFNMIVFGKKGYGKTSWIRGFIKNKQRVLFIDSMQYEYTEDDGVIVHDYTELVQYFVQQKPKRFRIVCRFTRQDILKLLALWSHLERTTLVVEEIDMYDETEIEMLVEHCDRGRHNENNLIGITRHPTELDSQLRKHIDSIVSFQQDDVNTVKYMSQINIDEAKKLPHLKKGEVIVLTGFEYLKAFYERSDTIKEGEQNDKPKASAEPKR